MLFKILMKKFPLLGIIIAAYRKKEVKVLIVFNELPHSKLNLSYTVYVPKWFLNKFSGDEGCDGLPFCGHFLRCDLGRDIDYLPIRVVKRTETSTSQTRQTVLESIKKELDFAINFLKINGAKEKEIHLLKYVI